MFMRNAVTAEPVARVTVPGDVRTIPLTELLRNEGTWSVSLKLVVFYLISVAIFFGVHALLKRATAKLLACPEDKRKQRTAVAALLAFALNFMGVVTLTLMGKSADAQIRLAMVGFPLFLIAESYVKLLRAEPQNRPAHWIGLISSAGGMVLASFFLLRGAPLH
jgi:peptidoglycan/LPS O-acetylase OafA/YrhL